MSDTTHNTPENPGTGAGSATNSGIDYQQRVSAWFLVAMLGRIQLSPLIGIAGDLLPASVAYEGSEHVDDLHIKTTSGRSLYLQIKRRVSLSQSKNSDWGKTITQFIKQHRANLEGDHCFLLATSPHSSSKITVVAKKCADAIRLAPGALTSNPWSKAERQVIDDIQGLIGSLFKDLSGRDMTNDDFIALMRKVYIVEMDVEQGRPHEVAALSLLIPLIRLAPELIWSLLITRSLQYAKSRSSVDVNGLEAELDHYLLKGKDGQSRQAMPLADQWNTVVKGIGIPSTGREYVLIDSFLPELDLLLVELFRFDEACKKRIVYSSSTVVIGPNIPESTVHFRGATRESVSRHFEQNQDRYKDKRLGMMEANGIEEADSSPCANLHAQFCETLRTSRQDHDKCLHCGRPLSQFRSLMVELDDSSTTPAIGAVHDECRRAVDRVIGQLEIPFFEPHPFLRRFDVERWARSLLKGGRAFNELAQSKAPFGPHTVIAWNPDNDKYRDFDWCVELELQDGSKEYLWSRGKLDRFPRDIAIGRAAECNRQIQNGQAAKDPHCFSSITKRYGVYSTLLKLREPDEECLEWIKATPVRYSEQIGKRYPADVQYYAPLLQLVRTGDESGIIVDQHRVLFTSPLDLPRFLANLKAGGVEVSDYEMRIIATDTAFDSFMRDSLDQGQRIVVNPLVDRRGSIVQGIFIVDLETAKRALESRNQG